MKNELNGKAIKLNEIQELAEHFGSALFEAFEHLPQALLQQIWDIDYEKKFTRLRTKPDDTWIIPWIIDEEVVAYLAFQKVNADTFSQVRYFGFEWNDFSEQAAEVLTLFRTRAPLGIDCNLRRDFLMGFCRSAMKNQGIEIAHATCTEKILPMYLRWDFELWGKLEINGYGRCHIAYRDR